MKKDAENELYEIFATLANCVNISDTKEPRSLSLEDIQKRGTRALELMDEMKEHNKRGVTL